MTATAHRYRIGDKVRDDLYELHPAIVIKQLGDIDPRPGEPAPGSAGPLYLLDDGTYEYTNAESHLTPTNAPTDREKEILDLQRTYRTHADCGCPIEAPVLDDGTLVLWETRIAHTCGRTE